MGALAVPFGVALAEDDPVDPADPVPTSDEQDRIRGRDRRQVDDPTPAGTQADDPAPAGPRAEGPRCACDGTGPQAQNRVREGGCEGPMDREREQNRRAEGTGDGPQVHRREQNRLEESTADDTDAPAELPEQPTTVDGAQLQFRYGDGPGRGNW